MGLAMAPLAYADNDNDGEHGKSGKSNNGNKSWVFNFGALGTTTDALMQQIKILQEELAKLKADKKALSNDDSNDAARAALKVEIKETKSDIKDVRKDLKFLRSLSRGMSGDDVRDLQELLAQDPSLFSPEFITGFFGPRTEAALRLFQKKHGIDSIGIFGPKTQAKILSLFIGRELPFGIIKRLGLEISSTTPGQGFVTLCHKPAGASPQTLVIAIPALGAHLAHGDSVGVCAGGGTPTDTTAPTFSNIAATSITTAGATIQWNTNEGATSQVEYGTTTSYGATTTLNATLVTSHSVAITGLTNGTLYHFRVISKDAAGNSATSGDSTFTTGTPDTTAPIISGLNASSTSATAANVIWATNENASSKVWYGTTTPVTLASPTLNAFNSTLVTNHLLGLSGLTASTTYYYAIETTDAANNTATSSTQSFVQP
ncbi:MAG: hypothetical protein G01um10148_1002 [Parcubacteria group bacterium Gr01-1014_8]|nr:MAG: hypothetical protein G01um10148_1002 [Parcubacteria group bacterium Gr01-1014_8]